MTERNEFGFEEWQSSADSFEEVPEWKSRAIWHAAIDAIRSKLAAKELWIAPMELPNGIVRNTFTDSMEDWLRFEGTEDEIQDRDVWSQTRDAFIGEHGEPWLSDND